MIGAAGHGQGSTHGAGQQAGLHGQQGFIIGAAGQHIGCAGQHGLAIGAAGQQGLNTGAGQHLGWQPQ